MRTDGSRSRPIEAPRAGDGLIRILRSGGVSVLVLAAFLGAGPGVPPALADSVAGAATAAAVKPHAPPAPPALPATPGASEAPAAPGEPPAPEGPKKIVKSLPASPGGSYTLAEDEYHRGNLYLFGTKLLIAGDQEGDVYFAGQSLQVTGLVQGDITGGCGSATFGGHIWESVLFGATNAVFTGRVEKDVTIGGTSIEFLDTSSIAGDLDAGGADLTFHGRVDGDATFKGGSVMITGTIGGDCSVESGRLEFGPEARIEGDLYYTVQEPIVGDLGKIVGGTSHEDASPDPDKDTDDAAGASTDEDDDRDYHLPGSGGFAWSIFCILGSLVVGSVCLALFPVTSRGSVEAIGADPLRTAGLGFVAAIVIPFALCLSCILIVTIPFALMLLFAWALVFFLIAGLPVAVWAGKWILAKLKRPDASLYLALLLGCILLSVLYHIPKLCILIWLVVHFLGFGGIASVTWSAWQSRRAARNGRAGSPPPPPPPPPPSEAPPSGYAPQTFGTGGA